MELGDLRASSQALDSARGLTYDEPRWTDVLERLGKRDLRVAASLVDRLVSQRDLTSGQKARLLMADGERWTVPDRSRAIGRFREAFEVAPDSLEGQDARARLAIDRLRTVRRVQDVDLMIDEFERLMVDGGGFGTMAASHALVLEAIAGALERNGDAGLSLFRRAEEVRDTLGMEAMASVLFVEVARRNPASVLAPKALLAAMALAPNRADSLFAVLRREYPHSPYTRVALGEDVPEYRVLEDSLRTLLAEAGALRSTKDEPE